jgi:hypothetical protein
VAYKCIYEQLDLEMNWNAIEMNKRTVEMTQQALETAVKGLEVGKLQSQVAQESKRFSVIMTVSSQNHFKKPKLGRV